MAKRIVLDEIDDDFVDSVEIVKNLFYHKEKSCTLQPLSAGTIIRTKMFKSFISFIVENHHKFVKTIIPIQMQPSRGDLRKRCSENMQQLYWRTPMPKLTSFF